MSKWKAHNPERFPVLWSDVALSAAGEPGKRIFLAQCSSRSAANHLMREICIWRKSLREFGNRTHRAYRAETEFRLAVKCDNFYRLWMTANPRWGIDGVVSADPEIMFLLTHAG